MEVASGGYLPSCDFMILIPTVFLRLLNSLEAIFRKETSTALQQKSQKPISIQVLECLPFIDDQNLLADDQTFSRFVSKVQNEQGIKCRSFSRSSPENEKL